MVEVYEDDGRNTWKLARKASPGKLGDFEEELFQSSDFVSSLVPSTPPASRIATIWYESLVDNAR